jgi:A/G-specific adenine glycosylase
MNKSEQFAQELLAWFQKNERAFPWRKTTDPYRILLAEIFLRKTDATKVCNIYESFTGEYPKFEALVKANERDLADFLRPLGLYKRRARELMELARIVTTAHHGEVPRSREELLELPGVGDYTANAVMCFAFGRNVPILDTNVIRIITRVFSFHSKRKRARDDPEMWRATRRILPKRKARDFNLAMLDLAATICLFRRPRCAACPVRSLCDYNTKTNS